MFSSTLYYLERWALNLLLKLLVKVKLPAAGADDAI